MALAIARTMARRRTYAIMRYYAIFMAMALGFLIGTAQGFWIVTGMGLPIIIMWAVYGRLKGYIQ